MIIVQRRPFLSVKDFATTSTGPCSYVKSLEQLYFLPRTLGFGSDLSALRSEPVNTHYKILVFSSNHGVVSEPVKTWLLSIPDA